MPLAFLAVSVFFLVLALDVERASHRPAVLSRMTFFAGWLVGELALHHVAAQVVVALAFVLLGGLASWHGALALGLLAVAWAVMLLGYRRAADTRRHFEAALRDGLGDDWDDAIPPETL